MEELHRIVLLVPFIRHYAGSVFELYEDPTPDGWDPDIRVREKIAYNRRSYLLPDNGKGALARLSQSDTILCPPGLFEGVDLHTGPCRTTAIQAISGRPLPTGNIQADLTDINGNKGQGIHVRMVSEAQAPFRVTLENLRDEQTMYASEQAENPFTLDHSPLLPGFYRALIESRNGYGVAVHFIKCFPLVVLLREGSRDVTGTMQTVY